MEPSDRFYCPECDYHFTRAEVRPTRNGADFTFHCPDCWAVCWTQAEIDLTTAELLRDPDAAACMASLDRVGEHMRGMGQ